MNSLSRNKNTKRLVHSILWRSLGFVLVWSILTGGGIASWGIGIPAVMASTYASLHLPHRDSFSLDFWNLLYFIPFFLRQSLRGGVDVARRVLHPQLPLNPGLVEFSTYLPQDTLARTLLVNTISLLPGTLVADVHPQHLTIHVLDLNAPITREIQALEARIAALCKLPSPYSKEFHNDTI
jgi:multicomponent Na+:H+ antiporter subunit E